MIKGFKSPPVFNLTSQLVQTAILNLTLGEGGFIGFIVSITIYLLMTAIIEGTRRTTSNNIS